jgi:hypothetical protein
MSTIQWIAIGVFVAFVAAHFLAMLWAWWRIR